MCDKVKMECYDCEEHFPIEDLNTNVDDEFICGDCGVQSHCFCEKCDDYIRLENSKQVDNHDSDEIVVLCDDCFEDYCSKCKECDYAYLVDEESEFTARPILWEKHHEPGCSWDEMVCWRCLEERQEPHKPKSKKPFREVHIVVKKWFDKINGNTYHSIQFEVSGKMYFSGRCYGYGCQYEVTFRDMFKKQFPNRKFDLYKPRYIVIENCKKKDLDIKLNY
jgi:hypothetical protein